MEELGLLRLSIEELAPKIEAREVSPVEVTKAAIGHAERMQPRLKTFITFLPEMALSRAHELERALMKGEYYGPLHGIPIGIKDMIHMKGVRTTNGTKMMYGAVTEAEADATVVTKLNEAGAVILGKENMHEGGAGCMSNNAIYGYCRNPWDPECHPGGSSGGSAANVAAYVTYGSVGTDGGGSIRMPASWCGVVGFKATYGRISQRGNTLNADIGTHHLGPMTRSVKDNAIMLQAMAGYDPLDPFCVPAPVDNYVNALGTSIKGLVMGIPRHYFFEHIDPEVKVAVEKAIQVIEGLGARVEEVEVPYIDICLTAWEPFFADMFVTTEPYLRNRREDYVEPTLRYELLTNQFLLAVDLIKAYRFRRLFKQEFAKLMEGVDFLVTPTTPTVTWPIEAESLMMGDVEMDLTVPGGPLRAGWPLSAPFNLIGTPAISIPCGFNQKGLPIGLQIVGRVFEESLVLRVAHSYQQAVQQPSVLPQAVTGALV